MAIIRKGSNQKKDNTISNTKELFSDKEINFIISKLRQSQYTGLEFEMFYSIIVKLQSFLESSEK